MHTTLHRLGSFDINEDVSEKEFYMRLQYRSMPNVIGFSLFTRAWHNARGHSFSIVENSLQKQANVRWAEWWRDMQDRRDISAYMKMRWAFN